MKPDAADAKPISTLAHWQSVWSDPCIPRPVDPADSAPANYYYRLVNRHFQRWLADVPRPASLIEVGCGGSRWLPYFRRTFGLDVAGLDYSDAGCAKANAILTAAGEEGQVVKGDFLSPPRELIGRFDVAVSFGLVEHFTDTAAAVAACASLLKPGGRIVTIVPTMRGLYGLLGRVFAPAAYRMHIPLDDRALAAAHRRAGLTGISTQYLLGLPGIINEQIDRSPSVARSLMWRLSKRYWTLEERGLGIPPNRFTSPYCACFGRRA